MQPSFAHGGGRVYQSPLPLWLYLGGAAATVLISFFIRSLADRTPQRREGRVVAGPAAIERVLSFFRVVGLALLGLTILFTFLDPDPGFTVTPLLFWMLLIVGTIVVSSLVAGVWERTNPWATIEGLVALTILMSLYTVSTLWLLSLPLVTES